MEHSTKIRLLLAPLLVFSVACDTEEQAANDETPKEVSSEETPKAKAVDEAPKAAADDAGPEDCKTYLEEVREACLAAYNDGMDVNCHMEVTKASATISQLEGKLFHDPNGSRSAEEMGHAVCKANIKSLRKKVAKAKKTPVDASADCKAFIASLDTHCFKPLLEGEKPGNGCTAGIMSTQKMDARGQQMCTALQGTVGRE